MIPYGKELILDLCDCDPSTFNRRSIKKYFKRACELMGVEPCKVCWWDDFWVPWFWKETEPHIKGTTAIQFLRVSDVRIHTLDLQKAVRLNAFSCDDFDGEAVARFSEEWFKGKIVQKLFIERF